MGAFGRHHAAKYEGMDAVSLVGVAQVTVAGGVKDVARLTGSSGNDTFTATPTAATLKGSGYQLQANGFGTVTVNGILVPAPL